MRAASTACLVLAATLGISAQQTFRAGVDLVHFDVTVVDRHGQPVVGLAREDFEVMENGKKQALQFFTAGEGDGSSIAGEGDLAGEGAASPMHLGLLLDTSGSMADDLKDARAAAVKFVNAMEHA